MTNKSKKRKARACKQMGFVPCSVEQANGRERGQPGMGIGALPNISPMARATRTPTKLELSLKRDRQRKQRGKTSIVKRLTLRLDKRVFWGRLYPLGGFMTEAKTERVTRQIGIQADSSILHTVGHCGIKPADESQLLAQGFELVGIDAVDDVATFTYERDV